MTQEIRERLVSGLLIFMLMIGMYCVTVDASDYDTKDYEDEEGVALVYSQIDDERYSMGTAFGIGTIGENTDTFVTNKHVICDEDNNWALNESVYLVLDEGVISENIYCYQDEYGIIHNIDYTGIDTSKMVKCNVLYVSEDYDFAILQTEAPVDRVALELADSAESEAKRTPVYAIGYPGISEEFSNEDLEDTGKTYNGYPVYCYTKGYNGRVEDATTTDGIISKFTRIAQLNDVWVIQHTASINNGNSGGPLVTADGLVLGINTYGLEEEGMNYAIYIDYVLDYLDQAGIPYNVTHSEEVSDNETSSSSTSWGSIIVVIAIIVIVIIVVVVVMGRRKPSRATNKTRDSRPVNKKKAARNQSETSSAQGDSKPRFCPYCGAQIKGDANFCGNCGKSLPKE